MVALDITEFKKLVKQWKSFKTPIVGIDEYGMLYGTDINCVIMKTIQTDIVGEQFLGNMTDITAFEKDTVCDKFIICYKTLSSYIHDNAYDKIVGYQDNDYINIRLLQNTGNTITGITNNGVSSYLNIQEDIRFKDVFELKASDGIVAVILDKYVFTMMNGLLPVTKSDKIDLYIYDSLYFFICDFIIHKGKMDMHVYIKYLYQNPAESYMGNI